MVVVVMMMVMMKIDLATNSAFPLLQAWLRPVGIGTGPPPGA